MGFRQVNRLHQPQRNITSANALLSRKVIPLQCRQEGLQGNIDHVIDCSHEELPRFSSVFSDRFMHFKPIFSQFLVDALSERTVATLPAPATPAPSQILAQRLPIQEISGTKNPDLAAKPPQTPSNKSDDDRERRRKEKEESAAREKFLHSLRGWSEINYGNDIYVAEGTCRWFRDQYLYRDWLTDTARSTICYIGAPGYGKTHLAQAISTHLKSTKPQDMVLSYFCQKGEEKPAVWEYFTWKLIKEWPAWFAHVPIQFRRQNDDVDPHLDSSAFATIWTSFRRARSPRTIYLIVDGLDQTPLANSTEFFAVVGRLRQPIAWEPGDCYSGISGVPTKVKLVVTSRGTNAAFTPPRVDSCCFLPELHIRGDISLYLDTRFLAVFNSRPTSHVDVIRKIKELIYRNTASYWLFAKLAADEIEGLCASSPLPELQEEYIPTELARIYEQNMLPLLQRANNSERPLRLVLTLIASADKGRVFSISQLESFLRCIYGQDDAAVGGIAESIRTHSGDVFWVSPLESLVLPVHGSVRCHLSSYIPPEHRQANMAFICLKYLLQDTFRNSPPQSWAHRSATANLMIPRATFYDFASQSLMTCLSKLKTVSPHLVPLLQKFLAVDCPQYQTWLRWRLLVSHEGSKEIQPPVEDPVMVLLREGCLAAVEHFSPSSEAPHGPWKRDLGAWARRMPSSKTQSSPKIARLWPNTTGSCGQTPLMAAALSGNPAMVEHVLQWDVDVNARDDGGRTALALCLESDLLMDPEACEQRMNVCGVIETLLRHGADPNISEQDGITPLLLATLHGRLDIARLLLRFNALANVTDSLGHTPLERAYSICNIPLVRMLIDHGADVEAWMMDGEPLLARCIFDGAFEMFNAILPFADVNQTTMLGIAPIHFASDGADKTRFLSLLLEEPGLHLDAVSSLTDRFQAMRATAVGYAIKSRNHTALEMLLEAGAYPGLLPMAGVPPLQEAVIAKDKSMVQMLLLYGAPVNDFAVDWPPHTALGYAVHLGLDDIVELLLRNGADASTEEAYGVMALIETAVTRSDPIPGIVRQLLESRHPPDVNYLRDGGDDCIMGAVGQGDPETVSLLLEHGADISKYVASGEKTSPFHEAARLGHVEACDVLLRHEPKLLDLQIQEGFMTASPLIEACHRNQKEVVRFLLDKGARADLLSYHGKESPLFAACQVGDMDIVKMILEAAPQMINVAMYLRYTPLMRACQHGNLDLIKLLIDAGAEIYCDRDSGITSVFNGVFRATGDKPFKTIDLLLRSGLDMHAVDMDTGLSLLGMAIIGAEARHVKWLLEHGADPLRAHRGAGGEEKWRTALQVAARAANKKMPAIVDLLLEPRWGLWDHLADKDYHGETMLPAVAPSRKATPLISRLVSVCDAILKETGQDILSVIINEPSIAGLTPVDCAINSFHAKPWAKPELDRVIVSRIDTLLAGPRTAEKHLFTLGHVVDLLFARGRCDADVTALAELVFTGPQLRLTADGYVMGSVALQLCAACDQSIYDPYFYCPLCEESCCLGCEGKGDAFSLHQHMWLNIGTRKDFDLNAPDVEETLERLRKELSPRLSAEAPAPAPAPTPALLPRPSDEGPIESSRSVAGNLSADETPPPHTPAQIALQLATLHAFNYLAISRPIGTPFLPLSPAAEAIVDPWQKRWSQEHEYCRRRNFMERAILGCESSAWRRSQELRYLRRGLTRAYMDEEAMMGDSVLLDVRRLYHDQMAGGEGAAAVIALSG
ncbi:hypothetical protein Trco_004936 [Trichoderma cornu-damae]|uniref:Nephrocystin 3-like N-terminal domain-containing protein n=1 Tax=Trichoderma cornu-damae TaxID=654480 RepID=A0A9P8TUW9_9HYPO|nr:hypothetical protein Trco_004936 [Trichoderma cornu-damae]